VGLRVEVRRSHPVHSFDLSLTARQQALERYALGIDVSRGQRVDTNILHAEFACHAARHLQHRRLGAVIRNPRMVLRAQLKSMMNVGAKAYFTRSHPVGDASGHGGDQDDTTTSTEARHLTTSSLCCEQHTGCVDLQNLQGFRPINTPISHLLQALTSLNCCAGYSKQSVCDFRIPAAATQKSNLCSLSPISSAFFHNRSWFLTSSLKYSSLELLPSLLTYS
jgi:hypothetical protein